MTEGPNIAARGMSEPVEPVGLDLRLPNAVLRSRCLAALSRSMCPMLSLHHHGLEKRLESLAARSEARAPPAGQVACELEGELAPAAAELKGALREITWRVLELVLGDDARDAVSATGKTLEEGRLCVRAYTSGVAASGPRLGAHCDSTLLTLLWTDGPGLQVYAPVATGTAGDWTAAQVLQNGVPTMQQHHLALPGVEQRMAASSG